MADALKASKETRAYTNNTNFMDRLYEKYGFDRKIEIRIFEEMIFVVTVQPGKKVVVTVLNSKFQSFGFSKSFR
jgi:hypothetical protein